jgi:hypothetical protein
LIIAVLVLGHRAAVAHPSSTSTSTSTAPPLGQASPLAASRLTPPPLLSASTSQKALAQPMSIWRKLGFGLVLTGPALMGTGVYLGAKQRDQSKGMNTFCKRGCGDEGGPHSLMDKMTSAPWLLVGAGTAALLGGGILLWSTRSRTKVQLGVGLRAGAPVALLKGRF